MSEINNCCGTTCDKRLVIAEIAELQKDNDDRAELSARLFAENQSLRNQLNMKELEVMHCHAVCDELREKLNTREADILDREADLILAVDKVSYFSWINPVRRVYRKIGTMMKTRAELARNKEYK